MNNDIHLLAVFSRLDQFLDCLKLLKRQNRHIIETFSPVRVPAMQDILTPRPSWTRAFTLAGGIIGTVGLLVLASYAHLSFRLIVYGKPVLAWIPWVIVAFEGAILLAALFAFVSWVFLAGLPRPRLDRGYSADLSGHKFGVIVSVAGTGTREIEEMLLNKGAERVSRVDD